MEVFTLPSNFKAGYLLKLKTTLLKKYVPLQTNRATRAYSFITYGEQDVFSGLIHHDYCASIISIANTALMAEWHLTYDNYSDIVTDKTTFHFYISPQAFPRDDKIYGVHLIRKLNDSSKILPRLMLQT